MTSTRGSPAQAESLGFSFGVPTCHYTHLFEPQFPYLRKGDSHQPRRLVQGEGDLLRVLSLALPGPVHALRILAQVSGRKLRTGLLHSSHSGSPN